MLTSQRRLNLAGIIILTFILVIYNSFFITYSLQKHAAFQTAGFDLGIWGQKMWYMAHGQPFKVTAYHEIDSISLGDHVDPISLLFTPLYALFPAPQTLIVIQIVLVSLGVWPIYWLAQAKFRSQAAGLIFGAIYLLFPALEAAITFDFHGITIAVPFLAYALWAMARRYNRFFMTMAILAMLCQEDIPLLTLMMGFYILGVQHRWRLGSLTVFVSGLWFGIANFIIIPAFSLEGSNLHFYRYQALGSNLGQIILTMLTHPNLILQQIWAGDKQLYWLRLTMPTAFMAWLDPLTLLLTLPTLLINTLSSYPPTYQLDRFHSSAPVVPFVVVAAINGLARLLGWLAPKFKHVKLGFLQNTLLAMLFLVTLIYQVQFGHTPWGRYFVWPAVTAHHRRAEAMLAQIPPQAAVAAQNDLVPRLSPREFIFILPKGSHQNRPADYIALDMRSSLTPYRYIEDYCAQLNQFIADPAYGLILADDGLLLFKRNTPDTAVFTSQPPCP